MPCTILFDDTFRPAGASAHLRRPNRPGAFGKRRQVAGQGLADLHPAGERRTAPTPPTASPTTTASPTKANVKLGAGCMMEVSDDDSGAPTVPTCLLPPRPASHARARPYRRRKPPSPTSHRARPRRRRHHCPRQHQLTTHPRSRRSIARAPSQKPEPLLLRVHPTRPTTSTTSSSPRSSMNDFHLHNDGVEEDRGHDASSSARLASARRCPSVLRLGTDL